VVEKSTCAENEVLCHFSYFSTGILLFTIRKEIKLQSSDHMKLSLREKLKSMESFYKRDTLVLPQFQISLGKCVSDPGLKCS
jgi:hypothetical protein